MTGDCRITARVRSLAGTHGWAKAGVMQRGGLDAVAAHGFTCASLAQGVAFQRRTQTGGGSAHTAGPAWNAPVHVRLERRGGALTGWASRDGSVWTRIGTAAVTLPATAQAGIAVSSHADGQLAEAAFSDVVLEALVAGPG